MSNLPPNPYNMVGPPQINANLGALMNHNPPFGGVPPSQLPPGYAPLKQDPNSNSPLQPQNSAISQVNNYNQSASSSPAFNQPGMMPSHSGFQSSPVRPPMQPPGGPGVNQGPQLNQLSATPRTVPNTSLSPYPPNYQPRQINDNAPPLLSSSHNQSLSNGPPMPGPGPHASQPSQFPASSSIFAPTTGSRPPLSANNFGPGPISRQAPPQVPPQGPLISRPPGPMSPPNVPFSGPPVSGLPRNSPLMHGPPTSGPPLGPPSSGPTPSNMPPVGPSISGPQMGPPTSGPPLGQPMNRPSGNMSGPLNPPVSGNFGPASAPQVGPPISRGINGPSNLSGPLGPPGPITGPPKGPGLPSGPMPPVSGLSAGPPISGPPTSQSYPGLYKNGPPGPGGFNGPQIPPMGPPSITQGPTMGQGATMGHVPMSQSSQMGPTINAPVGPMGPSKTNMQGRYPQMPQSNYVTNQPQGMQPHANLGKQYPQHYAQGLTQQMGQLSVTKQGFDQLWGHQMLDLLTCRHILPEYPEDPPEIRLGHSFADSPNCSPDIFRCTVNRMPESNSLLQKSRLPLGILIHPFKDLNHLPVIQCTTIVRCRACRTYINPFVYFVDAKRWKCNLCYRVNDLPEEFQYDPVSKSYGDPSRRPEIKSATIEFIAPGEYMLRPPQPAVYLFLMDVSQIARDSGYLQVVCDTLKNSLDQLPGDARTQVGFICYDAHIHYYLMSEGLTRPKEMTVLDIDDVFLPSPESLLVNLAERRELVRELLTALPLRHAAPGVPASALGAALQAAYKLMAPTGGRITVFQTCLPNIGPGALQPREDPNARSSADVAHLNPATDFYKRLALDCSGAQVAVDLFLLNSQYADLATLSGMSKFSAGTVYHIPLFRAQRQWQADQLTRMLQRYLTRKIGFEAVMRVRCTRGISIHTFHGNFFVRSTDLLSLPNVSPDAGFGMQLTIEESLADLQHVCFQAALLYTSSKGERRIRVHTLALPIASNLTDVLHSADQQCIIGLLSKMAVDRCATASLGEAREALMNVAVDALSAHRLAQNLPAGTLSSALHAPASLRLLPLYLLALLKRRAFRTGTSTRLDDRVADMCDMKSLPLAQVMRAVYPDLYPVHALRDCAARSRHEHEHEHEHDEHDTHDLTVPPRLHLSAERINSNGAYLLDDGETMLIYVCHAVSSAFLEETFGVQAYNQLPDETRELPRLDTEGNALLHAFIDKLNDDRPYAANILVLRDNSPNRQIFTERLVDDRVESSFSYYEFLQHIKVQVK